MKSKFSILITLFFFLVGCKWTLGTDANPPSYSVDTIARQEFGGDTHFLNIKENTAYLLDSENGVIEVDFTNLNFLEINNNYSMDSYAMDICSYGFVMVNGNANIIIKNIFGEYELLETLEYGELVDCIVVDDILYVADLDFGLRIIDITHEFFIAEIGDYFSGDGANKLLYQDNKIYLMNQGGLQIINVSNPAYPSIESQIYFEGMKDFDILGDFLYCIDDMILKIYNLQENNIEISETLITETATSVSISNTVLIISNSNQEIVAYNIVDKSSPQYLHSWYLNDEIRDIELIQNYVFVANSFDGFLIQRIEENLE